MSENAGSMSDKERILPPISMWGSGATTQERIRGILDEEMKSESIMPPVAPAKFKLKLIDPDGLEAENLQKLEAAKRAQGIPQSDEAKRT